MLKDGAMPYYTPFTPLFRNGFARPPFYSDLVQYTKTPAIDGILYDRIGRETRDLVYGWYISGDGSKYLDTDYISTALSYTDHTTGLTVNDTTDASGYFVVPTNGMDDFTIDGYTSYFEGGNQDNVVQIINTTTGEWKNITVVLSTPTDMVLDYDVEGYMDLTGYTIADGSTYYYDEALTQLVPSGKRFYNLDGKATGFTASGQADSVHTGEAKANMRVVDGVVDSKDEDFTLSENVELVSNGINFISTGITGACTISYDLNAELDANTEYVMVLDVVETNTSGRLAISSTSIADMSYFFYVDTVGEKRVVFTTETPISSNILKLVNYLDMLNGENVIISNIRHYPTSQFTNPLTDPLPTSGARVDGNSAVNTPKYSVFQADKLKTANNWFESDGTANVIPFADLNNVQDNVEYHSLNLAKQLLYNRTLTTEESTEVEDYLGF